MVGEKSLCDFVWCRTDTTPYPYNEQHDPQLPVGTYDNTYVYFRASVVLGDKLPKDVRIEISAYSEYQLFLNGEYIGRGPAPCSYKYPLFDVWDVADKLVTGRNVIAAICYFDSRHYQSWWIDPAKNPVKPGLFFCLREQSGSKKEIILQSGPGVKARASDAWLRNTPRISLVNGFIEVFDDAKKIGDFAEPDYDDSEWEECVQTFAIPSAQMNPRETLPLAVERESDYICLDTSELGGRVSVLPGKIVLNAIAPDSCPSVVLDFGRVSTGYPRFRLRSSGSGVVTMYFGETLNMKPMNRLIFSPQTAEYASFGRRAFRYLKLELTRSDFPVSITDLSLDRMVYPAHKRGSFQCDGILGRIWETSEYTLELSMQHHYEDSLWRERNLWLGDAYVCMLANYYTKADYGYDKKCLKQMAALQNPDGSIPPYGPRESEEPLLVDYICLFPVLIWNYFIYSGDAGLLVEMREPLQRFLKWAECIQNEIGVIDLARLGGQWKWFVDWHPNLVNKSDIGAMFYMFGLDRAAKIGEALKDDRLLASAAELKCKAEAAYRNIPFETRAASIGTLCGLQSSASKLAAEACKLEVITGYFYSYICQAMIQLGMRREVLQIIRNYWGAMLERGATTYWENFDYHAPAWKYPGFDINFDWSAQVSSCHAWSSGPCYLLPQAIWGVEPLSPGFTEFRIKPYLSFEFENIRSVIPTPHGDISLSAVKRGEELAIEINHPKELECRFDRSLLNISSTVVINDRKQKK